jgi:hypothetical protein
MTRQHRCAAVVAFLSIAYGAAALAAPDFSGRWTIDAAPPAGGGGAAAAAGGGAARGGGRGDMGSGWGSTITITQDAARLTVEYVFFGRGDLQPPLKFVYALDGSETKNSVMMGRGVQEQVSKTAWEGDTLVITTTHRFTDPATGKPMTEDVKQALTLESPTALIVETTRAGVLGGPSTATKTTYKKN